MPTHCSLFLQTVMSATVSDTFTFSGNCDGTIVLYTLDCWARKVRIRCRSSFFTLSGTSAGDRKFFFKCKCVTVFKCGTVYSNSSHYSILATNRWGTQVYPGGEMFLRIAQWPTQHTFRNKKNTYTHTHMHAHAYTHTQTYTSAHAEAYTHACTNIF